MKPTVTSVEFEQSAAQYPAGRLRRHPQDAYQPARNSGNADSVTSNDGRRRLHPLKALQLTIAAASVGGLALAGFNWYQFASTHEETDNAFVQGHVHQVSTRIPGTVFKVFVDDNQEVKEGQPMVMLDPRDFELKVRQAQSALESARRQAQVSASSVPQLAQVAQSQSTKAVGGIADARAMVSAAEANVEAAVTAVPVARAKLSETEATLKNAESDYRRYVSLEAEGAVSRQQLDNAQAAYSIALAGKRAAEEGIKSAESRLAEARQTVKRAQAQLVSMKGEMESAVAAGLQTEVGRTQLEASRAAVAEAESQLADAQLQLSYTEITAPATGRIGRKSVEAGQRLSPGQQIMAVVDENVWVVANFKETQLERMHSGQSVEVKLDTFPTRRFAGRVESIAPASGAQFALLPPDNATGNFTKIVQRVPVKIILDRESIAGYESRIVPGMSAVVSVTVKS